MKLMIGVGILELITATIPPFDFGAGACAFCGLYCFGVALLIKRKENANNQLD